MSKISLKVVTPERTVFEDSVDSILVTTMDGELTILPDHSPLASLLKAGEMKLIDNKNETYLAISTGLLEIREGNQVTVLADTAERSEELELEAIEEAKKLAEKRLEDVKNGNAVDFSSAAAHLEREMARHRVALKRKR